MAFARMIGRFVMTFLFTVTTLAQGGPTLLEFSFSNPGARSMGFGGAFIALADDATAAFANPAGLVQLVVPEASVEGRYWGYDTRFTEGGRASGLPTGMGIDNTPGLRFGVSSNDLAGISFLSLVYPVKDWSFAFFRHQSANFEAVTTTQGLFSEATEIPGATARNLDFRVSTSLDFVSYGVSAGYRLSERLNVGFGFSVVNGRMDMQADAFTFDGSSLESFFARNEYLPAHLINSVTMRVDSLDTAFTAGFQWRLSERFRIGGVYRDGPSFDADVVAVAGPAYALFEPSVAGGSILGVAKTPAIFPNVYGLGFTYRSRSETLTLNLDWVRLGYSAITENLNPEIFDDLPLINDGNEIHAGIEYVFLKTRPLVAVRLGGWFDPDHQLRTREGASVYDRAFFRGGDDHVHLAGGAGVVIRNFQLDLAFDLSRLNDGVSLSAIVKF